MPVRRRARHTNRLVAAAAAVVGLAFVAVTPAPVSAGEELRGSWAVDTMAGDSHLTYVLEITRQSNDEFSGSLYGGGTRAEVTGERDGDSITFTSSPGPSADPNVPAPGDTEWEGEFAGGQGSLTMEGTFDPPTGSDGEFDAHRVSSAVPIEAEDDDDDGVADPPATVDPSDTTPTTIDPARPPLPSGGREVAPGQAPHPCGPGESSSVTGATNGYYRSQVTGQWVSAPFCYARWGNLEASPPQLVEAGGPVTVTAIPTEGSNSGTYAPETNSITWTYPGTVESGCGNADLTCTVIPVVQGTTEWQWLEFHVTMPRTFFIDSPGDLCGGQHLCAGNGTNAWSYVGIPPSPEAVAAATSTIPGDVAQPPFGDPNGDPLATGDGGSDTTAQLALALTAGLGAIGVVVGSRTSTGGGKGMGGKGLGKSAPGSAKGGGMSGRDAAALLDQLNQHMRPGEAPPAPDADAPDADVPEAPDLDAPDAHD